MNILLGEFTHFISLVLQTFPTHASTNARGKPLTDESVDSQAITIELNQVRHSTVNTGTDTDKPVVAEFVGFIGATDNLAVFVAVTILLRIGAEGEAQETCYCKCTKNSFNTFHFFINKFKNYLFHWQQKALPTTAISCKVIKYFTKKQIFRFFFRIFVQEKTDSNAV
ncbi:MAG: hypothetical protein IJU74_08605 [Bacteroidales bacterium]|nr:hypothetical protein [Bacteroidales bacterium]